MSAENYMARKFHLVINSPDEYLLNREKILSLLNSLPLDYYCLADEVSHSGTPHVHIFIYSAVSPIRFQRLKNLFPMAHIEKAYGSTVDNRSYIRKEGKWQDTEKKNTVIEGSFYEYGEIPSIESEKAPLMSKVISYINDGMTTAEIIKENPKLAFKSKDIDGLRQTLLWEKYSKENRNVETIYIFGPSGAGKTSSIYREYPANDICRITNYKGDRVLFDSYTQQSVLVLEEFHSQIPLPELLSILDIYPLMLPARYHDKVACYHKVYIVSNIPLNRQYLHEQRYDEKTWSALLRRISVVREFREDHSYTDTDSKEGGLSWVQ